MRTHTYSVSTHADVHAHLAFVTHRIPPISQAHLPVLSYNIIIRTCTLPVTVKTGPFRVGGGGGGSGCRTLPLGRQSVPFQGRVTLPAGAWRPPFRERGGGSPITLQC